MTARQLENVANIAPQIDRLVWAVRDGVRARRPDMTASAGLSPTGFNPLVNLLSFSEDLSESFIRRRYTYRPEHLLQAFFTELEDGGYLSREGGDRLVPTDRLHPIIIEVDAAMTATTRSLWEQYAADVEIASIDTRTVMEAGSQRDGLLQVALAADEAADPYRRFWQRLSALRLLRNEAHVEAWRAADLTPGDIEALTDAWAGSLMQAPVEYSQTLIDRGYVRDGAVTESGLHMRQQIEDATNTGVVEAFSVINTERFLWILTSLPPAD